MPLIYEVKTNFRKRAWPRFLTKLVFMNNPQARM